MILHAPSISDSTHKQKTQGGSIITKHVSVWEPGRGVSSFEIDCSSLEPSAPQWMTYECLVVRAVYDGHLKVLVFSPSGFTHVQLFNWFIFSGLIMMFWFYFIFFSDLYISLTIWMFKKLMQSFVFLKTQEIFFVFDSFSFRWQTHGTSQEVNTSLLPSAQ